MCLRGILIWKSAMAGKRDVALQNLKKANEKRLEGVRSYKQMSGEYRQRVLQLALKDWLVLEKIKKEDPKFFYGVIVKQVIDKVVDLNVEVTSFSPFKDLEKFKTPQHVVDTKKGESEKKKIILEAQVVNPVKIY